MPQGRLVENRKSLHWLWGQGLGYRAEGNLLVWSLCQTLKDVHEELMNAIFHRVKPSSWRLLFHQNMVLILDSLCKTDRTRCDNKGPRFGQIQTILAPLISDIFIQVMLLSPSSIWQLRCRSPPWSRAAGLPGSTWHTDGRWEGHSRIQPEGRREGREKKTWLQNQQRWLDTELLWKRVSFAAALQFSCGYTLMQWNETDCIPLCNELICNHAQLCESLFNTRRITIWFIFNPI